MLPEPTRQFIMEAVVNAVLSIKIQEEEGLSATADHPVHRALVYNVVSEIAVQRLRHRLHQRMRHREAGGLMILVL